MPAAPSAAGLKVIIAGAGGAAHLPGMTASMTNLPVFGVPIESRALKGLDSLLSIAQMPAGIPVGTLAIGEAGAVNAALLAAAVLALGDRKIASALGEMAARPHRCRRQDRRSRSNAESQSENSMSADRGQVIPPGGTIGILGGGQLGRMTAMAAARLGYRVHSYCPEANSPAFQVSAASTRRRL